jgi:hypothetical protein
MNRITKSILLALIALLAIVWSLMLFHPGHVRRLTLEDQVQANLQQFVAMAYIYMIDTDVNAVTYTDIYGPGKLQERLLESCLGEDYNDLVIKDTDTKLSVKSPDGRTFTVKFEPFKE